MRQALASMLLLIAAATAVAQDETPAEKFIQEAQVVREKQAHAMDRALGSAASPALPAAIGVAMLCVVSWLVSRLRGK